MYFVHLYLPTKSGTKHETKSRSRPVNSVLTTLSGGFTLLGPNQCYILNPVQNVNKISEHGTQLFLRTFQAYAFFLSGRTIKIILHRLSNPKNVQQRELFEARRHHQLRVKDICEGTASKTKNLTILNLGKMIACFGMRNRLSLSFGASAGLWEVSFHHGQAPNYSRSDVQGGAKSLFKYILDYFDFQ